MILGSGAGAGVGLMTTGFGSGVGSGFGGFFEVTRRLTFFFLSHMSIEFLVRDLPQ